MLYRFGSVAVLVSFQETWLPGPLYTRFWGPGKGTSLWFPKSLASTPEGRPLQSRLPRRPRAPDSPPPSCVCRLIGHLHSFSFLTSRRLHCPTPDTPSPAWASSLVSLGGPDPPSPLARTQRASPLSFLASRLRPAVPLKGQELFTSGTRRDAVAEGGPGRHDLWTAQASPSVRLGSRGFIQKGKER